MTWFWRNTGRLCLFFALSFLLAGVSAGNPTDEVSVTLQLPITIECYVDTYDNLFPSVKRPGVYVIETPAVIESFSNTVMGVFRYDCHLTHHGNLGWRGVEIPTWYFLTPAGGGKPGPDDHRWIPGSEFEDSYYLADIFGEREFELWCKVQVDQLVPGLYSSVLEVTLTFCGSSTCVSVARFSCRVLRAPEDELEIIQDLNQP